MDSLKTMERGIEVQKTIGFNVFNEVDPIYHESLYYFAKIIFNYMKMDMLNKKDFSLNRKYSIKDDPLKCIKCDGDGIMWLGKGSFTTGTHWEKADGTIGITCDRCNGRGIVV